ncbi:hypothetical protein J1614_010146 [Plenodomus biglobosus]|nr:hypothetical protein J1614_010146 [Plenodomus biglobosus]
MEQRPRRILGKRVQRVACPEEPVEQSERKVSRRTRVKDKADGVQQSSAVKNEPWTMRLRSGILTSEASNLAEKDMALAETPSYSPQDTFPFMRLPAELRINVYNKVLVRDEPLMLHAERVPDKSDEKPASNNNSSALPPPPPPPPPPPRPRPISRVSEVVPERRPLRDPISPQLLRVNSLIYKEARQVLYSDNVFTLSLESGVHTLSTLHQRSRSLVKHVTLTIPSHHDILDGFADLVRLGLRYCWGLKSFRIILQASLPDDGRLSGTTSVYANAFHILRWLPRGCSVVLEGNVCESVRRVVAEEGRLQSVLDETSYLKRQHQMPERH